MTPVKIDAEYPFSDEYSHGWVSGTHNLIELIAITPSGRRRFVMAFDRYSYSVRNKKVVTMNEWDAILDARRKTELEENRLL